MVVEIPFNVVRSAVAVELSGSEVITSANSLNIGVPSGKLFLLKTSSFTPGTGLTFDKLEVDGNVLASVVGDASFDAEDRYGQVVIVREKITVTGGTSDAGAVSVLRVKGLLIDEVL